MTHSPQAFSHNSYSLHYEKKEKKWLIYIRPEKNHFILDILFLSSLFPWPLVCSVKLRLFIQSCLYCAVLIRKGCLKKYRVSIIFCQNLMLRIIFVCINFSIKDYLLLYLLWISFEKGFKIADIFLLRMHILAL